MAVVAPETRIWAGRVGGDPALQRNASYRLDMGLGGIFEAVRFGVDVSPVFPTLDVLAMAFGLATGGEVVGFESNTPAAGPWAEMPVPPPLGSVADSLWISQGAGVVGRFVCVGDLGIAYTDDGGATWSHPVVAGSYSAIVGSGTSLVTVGLGGAQARSTDGGVSWSVTAGPFVNAVDLVYEPVAGNYVLCTDSAAAPIYTSPDDGASFTNVGVVIATTNAPSCLATDGAGMILLGCVNAPAPNGLWFNCTDGGLTWVASANFTGDAISAIYWYAPGALWILSAGSVFHYSTDGLSTSSSEGVGGGPYRAFAPASADGSLVVAVGAQQILAGAPIAWAIVEDFTGVVESFSSVVVGLGAYFAPPQYPRIPRVNVIHYSRNRPAANRYFDPGLFSPGVGVVGAGVAPGSVAASPPAIVDVPLVLNWELEPGDVLVIDPEFLDEAAIIFVGNLMRAPGAPS